LFHCGVLTYSSLRIKVTQDLKTYKPTASIVAPAIFKWRQTAPELVSSVLAVAARVEELLAERGLEADYTTI
jgi:hypothetical protein